jgi:hypothetical protein
MYVFFLFFANIVQVARAPDYILNYFPLGMDFVLDGWTHRVWHTRKRAIPTVSVFAFTASETYTSLLIFRFMVFECADLFHFLSSN